MSLLNLLKTPSAYNVGGGSKKLDYPDRQFGFSQGPLLGKRVDFDLTNEEANPKFIGGGGYTKKSQDQFIRGGISYAAGARLRDFNRIIKFLSTPDGISFLAKQSSLQILNPRPQKLYNYGLNTLASIASAGVSNIRRGSPPLLPKLNGSDIGTYLGDIGDDTERELREKKYYLGDPGKPSAKEGLLKLIGLQNPLKNNTPLKYDVYIQDKIDKVNELPILEVSPQIPNRLGEIIKDFIPFRFEINNPDKKGRIGNDLIVFRAFLDSMSDDYNATHNSFKYNGRGEEFYTYNKFNRKINVKFKIAAQSRHEMKSLYTKLNYLVAQTAPNYSREGRIRTPWMFLTIGDWIQRIPGLINNVNLSWNKNYPWEIASDRISKNYIRDGCTSTEIEGKDKTMLILPHVLDVSLSFQPIHRFTPDNTPNSPYIGIEGDGVHDNWLDDSQSYDYDKYLGKKQSPTIVNTPVKEDIQALNLSTIEESANNGEESINLSPATSINNEAISLEPANGSNDIADVQEAFIGPRNKPQERVPQIIPGLTTDQWKNWAWQDQANYNMLNPSPDPPQWDQTQLDQNNLQQIFKSLNFQK